MPLHYHTVRNMSGVPLNGATISPSDFIFTNTVPIKGQVQFGVDGVYRGLETYAGGSPIRFKPVGKGSLGGSNNGEQPNGLTAGAHTMTVKDREGAVIDTATFTVGGV